MEDYKCSCCDSENAKLRDLGFDEYIPLCDNCYNEHLENVKSR